MTPEEEDRYSLEAKFDAAVKVIWSLPEDGPYQPSDDMMLMFYSYYKQATLGPCNIPRPVGFWGTRGKAKWDAWSALGNMTREEAMKNYVEDIQLILETIPISNEVTDLVQKLGNFYTEVESNGEDVEENEVDKRPFTRPFAKYTEQAKKPTMQGFGDLWGDIQNLQETKKDGVCGLSVDSEETKCSRDICECIQSEEEENGGREDISDGEYKQEEELEEKGGSPDPRLLMVEDKRWRFDTQESSSSVELSVSSFTNGTHSSLNSEVEEDELACSIEPSTQYNPYIQFNGHLGDHTVAEENVRCTDSDNEEFCDSIEHLAMEEGLSTSKVQSHGSSATSVKQSDLWFESHSALNNADGITTAESKETLSRRGTAVPESVCDSQLCETVNVVCGFVSQSSHSRCSSRGNINEQIATALKRLQHDMASVLHRLQVLEVIITSQSQPPSPEQDPLPAVPRFLRPSWWPFQFSPITVVFTALWPAFAHWLVQCYLQRKRRKIT